MAEPTVETWYIVAVLGIVFTITFGLRALPFAILGPLRRSPLVKKLSLWMPAGILLVLAASTMRNVIADYPSQLLAVGVASAVTVAVHLLFGRRTLLSVGLGTLSFVLLVNLT